MGVQDKILQAIVETEASPAAKERAAELVEAWIDRNAERDSQEKTYAVETKFMIRLDELTWVIGIVDRLSLLRGCIVLNEWKTTREPNRFWNEDKWLEEILSGIQLGTYGLALTKGVFKTSEGSVLTLRPSSGEVLVRVRAAVKSRPAQFWPTGQELFELSPDRLEAAAGAYLNMARVIRTLRSSPDLPWQSMGDQCPRQFGHPCEFIEECRQNLFPKGNFRVYDPVQDKEYLESFGVNLEKLYPNAVILSPSSYHTATLCLEKFRRTKELDLPREEESKLTLDIGKAFHAGLAAYYSGEEK